MNQNLIIGYQTHKGLVRTANEDSLFIDEELGLFIVADGMGGHNAGEVASKLAVQEIPKQVRKGLALGKDAFSVIKDAIREADRAILEASMREPAWTGMGTTVVLAFLRGNNVLIGHIGDSRAYMIRTGKITGLTEDHSLVAHWMAEGLITPEEARTHPARHTLLMALGTTGEIRPAISYQPLENHDCILLCSDGLTEMLSDSELLETVVQEDSPQDVCNQLVRRANEKGGRDNITIILFCYNVGRRKVNQSDHWGFQ